MSLPSTSLLEQYNSSMCLLGVRFCVICERLLGSRVLPQSLVSYLNWLLVTLPLDYHNPHKHILLKALIFKNKLSFESALFGLAGTVLQSWLPTPAGPRWCPRCCPRWCPHWCPHWCAPNLAPAGAPAGSFPRCCCPRWCPRGGPRWCSRGCHRWRPRWSPRWCSHRCPTQSWPPVAAR